MHQIFFGLKRAFHGTLRVGRALLKDLGLTAARFDMMFAIQRASAHHAIVQGDLRGVLGVSGATISRMLDSLEKLGYLTRERWQADRRRVIVRLTEEGLARIRHARAEMIESGWAHRRVKAAIPEDMRRDPSDYDVDEEVQVLRWQLVKIRRAYQDIATLHYPPPRRRTGPWVGPPRPKRMWPPLHWQHPRRHREEIRRWNRTVANPGGWEFLVAPRRAELTLPYPPKRRKRSRGGDDRVVRCTSDEARKGGGRSAV